MAQNILEILRERNKKLLSEIEEGRKTNFLSSNSLDIYKKKVKYLEERMEFIRQIISTGIGGRGVIREAVYKR
ncbi:MAG: hypothetical protein NY202_01060 [Mollicutes bacterium UO1]